MLTEKECVYLNQSIMFEKEVVSHEQVHTWHKGNNVSNQAFRLHRCGLCACAAAWQTCFIQLAEIANTCGINMTSKVSCFNASGVKCVVKQTINKSNQKQSLLSNRSLSFHTSGRLLRQLSALLLKFLWNSPTRFWITSIANSAVAPASHKPPQHCCWLCEHKQRLHL